MKLRNARLGITTLIIIILALGIGGTLAFTKYEKTRTLNQWQEKLNLIADAHAREVNGWLGGQFRELSALADNASLQIYFTTLSEAAQNAKPTAQADYLRNLLTLTSQRLGFEPQGKTINQRLGANVRALGTGGLALITRDGRVTMTTASMPPLEENIVKELLSAPLGKQHFWDNLIGNDSKPNLVFSIPVYGVQSEGDSTSQIGMLVGIRPMADVYPALTLSQGTTEKTLEVVLVRSEQGGARYLSPLLDGAVPLSQREASAPESAAAFALTNADSFSQKTDYRGKPVLLTSRMINNTSWALMAKVDRSEALAALMAKRNSIITSVALLIAALVATVLALWRHATARQQAQLAREYGAQAQLLSVVTNHQPEPLYIVDSGLHIHFTNQRAADLMQSSPSALNGKVIADTVGAAFAAQLRLPVQEALRSEEVQTIHIERENNANGDIQHVLVKCIPLADIPVDDVPRPTPGVLVVEQDTTEVMVEREMRLNTLNQLVAMLVSLVDKRDPNAASHSERVAILARATAEGMGLDAETVETTETAARLMNLGKVDVPVELLTRHGELNEAERNAIRTSLSVSAELLKGVAFRGPVADTLRQAQEHVDGTGPLKLKGEDILISARIIAASNALVSMVSPRAYRSAMTPEAALKILQSETARRFDRKVISALTHYMDNQGGTTALRITSNVA